MADSRLSAHFATRQPSVIRLAQIEFAKRQDATRDLNVAIGNVSLPMHPAMLARLRAIVASHGAKSRPGSKVSDLRHACRNVCWVASSARCGSASTRCHCRSWYCQTRP